MSDKHSSSAADHDDLDAAFAAMMEGLEVPEDTRADLEALDAAAAGDGPAAAGGSHHGRPDDDTLDAPPALSLPTRSQDQPGKTEQPGQTELPQAVKIAVVLTPLANAEALAQLCAMSGLDCLVLPTRTGAVAVKEFVSAHSEWDVSELLGGVETEPAEAAELAGRLSHLARGGTILLTADLATDVGIEKGLSGSVTARGYERGEGGPDMSAGLVLASVDPVVEDLLLGVSKPEDLPGVLRSKEVKLGPLGRWMGRGMGMGKGPAPM